MNGRLYQTLAFWGILAGLGTLNRTEGTTTNMSTPTVISNPCWCITTSVPITRREKVFGSERLRFTVAGLNATLVLPTGPAPGGARPWVWYAPLGLGDGNAWAVRQLLAAGFAVGCINAGETMGNPGGRLVFREFYKLMVNEFKLAPKPCLMPQSRGGLMLYNWAADYPDCVQCIGAIYPVCDMTSWPGLAHHDLQCAYGMSEEELKEHLAENNPMERLAPLAARRIPIYHITGDSDTTVPMEKNSLELKRRYEALGGGTVTVEIVKGKGHDGSATEIFQSQSFVDFFLSQIRVAR